MLPLLLSQENSGANNDFLPLGKKANAEEP